MKDICNLLQRKGYEINLVNGYVIVRDPYLVMSGSSKWIEFEDVKIKTFSEAVSFVEARN